MKTNQQKYEALIDCFETTCRKWNHAYSTNNIKFVFNNDLQGKEIDAIEYIFLGDNPGETELRHNQYLVNEPSKLNNSGTIAKCIFDKICLSQKYIVLNKTPIFSKKTSDLRELDRKILDKSLRYMAILMYKIQMLKPTIKIYIFGFGDGCFSPDGYHKSGTLSAFFEKMKILYKGKDDSIHPRIMKHFSYRSFFNSFKYCKNKNRVWLSKKCKNIKKHRKRLRQKDLSNKNFPIDQLKTCIDKLPYRQMLWIGE